MQRNIDYSEDLARKHEQNMEIERLKVFFYLKLIFQFFMKKENNRKNGIRK